MDISNLKAPSDKYPQVYPMYEIEILGKFSHNPNLLTEH